MRLAEEAARIGVPGMAVKSDKPLTDAQRQEIIRATREFQTRYGLIDRKLARQVGKSYATVRAVLRSEYGADPDPILRTIANKIAENRKRIDAPTDGEFVMTSVAREVMVVADMCVQSGRMGAVVAPAGSGKTMALQALPLMPNFDRAIYIAVKSVWTPTALGRSLARAIGADMSIQSASILFDRIVLTLRDSNRLIILDEAQYLPRRMLSMVRQIHDESRVPILLGGTPELKDLILGDGVDATLTSRVPIFRDLTARCRKNDGEPLHSLDDIRRIFEAMKLTFHDKPVKLDRDALTWMYDVANLVVSAPGKGDLRMACNVAKYALMTFRNRKAFTGTITLMMLQKVSELQIGLVRANDLSNDIAIRKAAG